MTSLTAWLAFAGLAAAIAFLGYRLSLYAEVLAQKLNLNRSWVGAILLATVTSLPELMSGISAVSIANEPDLAVGDLFGSCAFNLLIIFIIDLFSRKRMIFDESSRGHVLTAGIGIILLSFAGLGMVLSREGITLQLWHVGGPVLMLPIFYLIGMRMLYLFDSKNEVEVQNSRDMPQHLQALAKLPTKIIVWRYLFAALGVVAVGILLPIVAEEIVRIMGWNSAFVGTMFLALATSLPELTVCLAVLKFGSIDLAISNVLASNLFNIVILTIDDMFYTEGPILQHTSPTHIVTVFSAIMMTGLVLLGLIYHPRKRILNLVSLLSILILIVYTVNMALLYSLSE